MKTRHIATWCGLLAIASLTLGCIGQGGSGSRVDLSQSAQEAKGGANGTPEGARGGGGTATP